jgi:glycerophosphoryl diester phosphodiesterase
MTLCGRHAFHPNAEEPPWKRHRILRRQESRTTRRIDDMRTLLPTAAALTALAVPAFAQSAQLGPRPAFLVDRMEDGELKERLAACETIPMEPKLFSIGHRGAALQFPEHTVESYVAAARQGAGIIECDVTFTKDKELVCRHAQNDLHATTDILATDLASTCVTPFAPATPASEDGATEAVPAAAECRASELTLTEFRTLRGKMDAADTSATSVEGFVKGTADWRTDLYADSAATLLTHAESIEIIRSLGGKFTPELKSPSVEMPFDGFSQED